MAGATGRPRDAVGADDVAAELRRRPERFGLFEALRLLERAHPDRPRLGRSRRPAEDPVRIGQAPSLSFAPCSLARWEPGADGRPPRLVARSFGLFGPDGALPLHLTEYARNRQRNEGDATLTRFVDLFHHRMASFLYRAWAEARPTVQRDRPGEDLFAGWIGSLFGLPGGDGGARDPLAGTARLHFAGVLSGGTRPPDGLCAMVTGFFGVPAAVEEFVARSLELPRRDRLRLGETPRTGALGRTTTLGARIRDRQSGFRLVLGPMSLDDYRRLLPGGGSLARLDALVRGYTGDELDWDVRLVLAADQIPEPRLGGEARLGLTTWLGAHAGEADRGDLCLRAEGTAA